MMKIILRLRMKVYTLYIAEEKLQECPTITIKIGEEEVSAILDTGCELTIMNENLYEKIK
jgi:hypothetical protein